MKSKTQSSDRMRVMLGFAVLAMVLVSLVFYGMAAVNYGTFDISELFLPVIAGVLAIVAALFIKDKMRSVRAGLPAEDEMSKRGIERAGYYSYLATIYIALGVGFVSDTLQIAASAATGMIILFSAIIFIGLAFYYRSRGV